MGRDNKQGQTNNASSLPQTPKQEKISARAAQEEFSRELSQLEQLVLERKRNKNINNIVWWNSHHKARELLLSM